MRIIETTLEGPTGWRAEIKIVGRDTSDETLWVHLTCPRTDVRRKRGQAVLQNETYRVQTGIRSPKELYRGANDSGVLWKMALKVEEVLEGFSTTVIETDYYNVLLKVLQGD